MAECDSDDASGLSAQDACAETSDVKPSNPRLFDFFRGESSFWSDNDTE